MNNFEKTKLGLTLATDPNWVNLAEKNLEEILTDHAYCEQKAASSIIALIINFSEKENLVQALSPIVTEEWGHFRMVLAELSKRGLRLGRQRKDDYVAELLKYQRKGGSRDENLLERLLTCALIEARSAERFRLLSIHLKEEELKSWYYKFMVSEAGHYKLFLQLAKEYCGEEKAMKRWNEYLIKEAEILENLKPKGDRMH
jgi:tRNA 2-(methylsulfanyl)-N6-isopentenyladenosine37 hydroxylase